MKPDKIKNLASIKAEFLALLTMTQKGADAYLGLFDYDFTDEQLAMSLEEIVDFYSGEIAFYASDLMRTLAQVDRAFDSGYRTGREDADEARVRAEYKEMKDYNPGGNIGYNS